MKDNWDCYSLWVDAEVTPVACVVGRAAVLASDVTVVFDSVSELRAHERLVAVNANAVILVHITHITHIARFVCIVWLGLPFSSLAIIRLDFVVDFIEAGRPAIWGLFEPVCLAQVFTRVWAEDVYRIEMVVLDKILLADMTAGCAVEVAPVLFCHLQRRLLLERLSKLDFCFNKSCQESLHTVFAPDK